MTDLARFCTDPRKFCIIGVDPTYNVGPCYVILTTYQQLQFLIKKGEHPVMMGPAIIHTRKEYGSYFNIPSKLIKHKSSLNKIITVGSDSEKNVYQQFKYLMPNLIHLLCNMHMKDNIKEKALKLGFTKSEVGRLNKDIFGKQIEDTVEKGLADSLTTKEFTATMNVLEQKWKNIGQKGSSFINISKIANCTKKKVVYLLK